jgi:hypothetical protein
MKQKIRYALWFVVGALYAASIAAIIGSGVSWNDTMQTGTAWLMIPILYAGAVSVFAVINIAIFIVEAFDE